MQLVLAQYKAGLLSLSRNPGYFIGSIVFPALFFLFFVPSSVRDSSGANFALGSFMIFAVMGALFFGFAVGIAHDRASAWAVYERTLPAPPLVRLASRVLNGFTFAACATIVMALVAHLTTPVHLPPVAWGRLALALLAGAIPISLLGFAIGYFASSRGAVTLAQLFYLPLSYAGGLCAPPQQLPTLVQPISLLTPTRRWGEVVWPAVTGQPWHGQDFAWLAVFTLIFGALALWGYRRDEGQRFS
ncbi:MAG: ABC transporter permease [Meiothermus ruber]|nr:ABC transporter permease [Meiothermus ruber]